MCCCCFIRIASYIVQAVKKQRLTDASLISLVTIMGDAYSVVDEIHDLPDKIKSLEAVIALTLQQISECAIFIREYVYRGFTGTSSSFLLVLQTIKRERNQDVFLSNCGRTKTQKFRSS